MFRCLFMKGELSIQRDRFLTPTCQFILSNVKQFPLFNASNREKFLSPRFSKFAVECDLNSKISQNVRKKFHLKKR